MEAMVVKSRGHSTSRLCRFGIEGPFGKAYNISGPNKRGMGKEIKNSPKVKDELDGSIIENPNATKAAWD